VVVLNTGEIEPARRVTVPSTQDNGASDPRDAHAGEEPDLLPPPQDRPEGSL
jgi:hypothetical protein